MGWSLPTWDRPAWLQNWHGDFTSSYAYVHSLHTEDLFSALQLVTKQVQDVTIFEKFKSQCPALIAGDIDPNMSTHNGRFQNFSSFHGLSGVESTHAHMAAYKKGPFHSNLEFKAECHGEQPKNNHIWKLKCVMGRTLALYQQSLQPKAWPSLADQPPAPISNPWDKMLEPMNTLCLQHKFPASLPKRWEPADSSGKATVVPKIPDAAIAKSSMWLDPYTTKTAHAASFSASLLKAAYSLTSNFISQFRIWLSPVVEFWRTF